MCAEKGEVVANWESVGFCMNMTRYIIFKQPVAILRAVFWRDGSFWMMDGEVLGNQTGAAYVIDE